jgi:hypothetical protein
MRTMTDKLPRTITHVFHHLQSNQRMTLTRTRSTNLSMISMMGLLLLHE